MATTYPYTTAGSFTLTVPAESDYTIVAVGGGGGGAYSAYELGAAGVASTVTVNGTLELTAAGGAGGSGSGGSTSASTGASPGSYTVNGIQYTGGGTAAGSGSGTAAGNSPGGGGGGHEEGFFGDWDGGSAGAWNTYSSSTTASPATLVVTVGAGGLNGGSRTLRGGTGAVWVVVTAIPLPQAPATPHGSGALSATAKAEKFSFTSHFTGHGALTFKGGVIFEQLPASLHGAGQLASSTTYQRFFVYPQLGANVTLAGIITNDIIFFPVSGQFFVVADPSITGVLNEPIVAPVNATVTFTPRLPAGTIIPLGNYLVNPAFNALQQVFLINNPTGGTWTLSFGAYTTTALAYNISAAALQSALEALPIIGFGNVNVTTGTSPDSYNVEFIQDLGNEYMPPMVGDADLLSNAEGPGFCEITVTVSLLGSPMVIEDTATTIGVIAAQIYNGQLCTVDSTNTPGIELVANSSQLALDQDLIYDVDFTNITYNGVTNNDIIAPFAFTAPTDPDAVSISDPALTRLPYKPISQTTPSLPNSLADRTRNPYTKSTWRERAKAAAPAPKRRVRATVPKRRGT